MKHIRHGTLEYFAADAISVPHAFTTRLGGVSQGPLGSLNLSLHRGDDPEHVAQNFQILTAALGFDSENLVLSHQTHSDIIRVVTKADARGLDHHLAPECDGLITCDPGTALFVFTADCTPILLQDPVTGAVGAVHAGWRSTAADIAGKAVRAMCEQFGCRAENIRAAIGPNIGACCFQTDKEVPDAMRDTYGSQAQAYIHRQAPQPWHPLFRGGCQEQSEVLDLTGGVREWLPPPQSADWGTPLVNEGGKVPEKYYVDLKGLNALGLTRAGVRHITISRECTMCRPDRYYSHRLQGPQRGSQGAVILCKEGTL